MTEEPRDRGVTAGAWAAASLVLALGGLGFGVAAHLRVTDLEERLSAVEAAQNSAGRSGGSALGTGVSSTRVPAISTTTVASEPPPDVAAAKASILTAFTTVYNGGLPNETRLALIDDPTGVDAALTAAITGTNAAVASTISAQVSDIVFSSATRATITYTVGVAGQPPSSPRQGAARLASGTWKVTRETVCTDLAVIGSPCA